MISQKRVIYADFSKECLNYGNHIIEFATQKLIENQYLEVMRFDSFNFHNVKDINACLKDCAHDFILIPGCTMYTNGQNKALNAISEDFTIKGFAGSIWQNNFFDKKINIFNKVISKKSTVEVDLEVINKISGVVGCRDSFTYKKLLEKKIPARYVGCPTLFLEEGDLKYKNHDDDYCLFSFSRENVKQQVQMAKILAKTYRVVGICHEIKDFNIIKSLDWNFPLIDYQGDIDKYLSYFLNAAFVVTGRLHGVLPSIAFGKKVIYFGNDDSRTTILDDILVEKVNLDQVHNVKAKLVNKNIIYDIFEENMRNQIEELFKV